MKLIPINAAILTLLFAAALSGQQPPPDSKNVIKTSTDEVVLDVVVRDKKGKDLKELNADDFEVTDNGIKQNIRGFRRVEGRDAIAKGASVPLDPLRQIRLVTLAFEGLGPEARKFARSAALDLIKGSQAQNVFFSVMTIDRRLNVIQQFTDDHDAIRRAVDRATSGAFTEFVADTARIREELRRELAVTPDGRTVEEHAVSAASPPPTTGTNPDASGFVQAKMAQVMLTMLQMSDRMSNEDASRSTIFSLLSMIQGQATLPGRKVILYFS